MKQDFTTLEEMINYIYDNKNKDDIKLKIDNVLKYIGRVFKESTEEYKFANLLTLTIMIKYYLVNLGEYKTAYNLFRDIWDSQYDDYLKDHKELNGSFLFAVEVELISAMEICEMSKELKKICKLILINNFELPEEHEIGDLHFNFRDEHIRAYGKYIVYITEKNDLSESLFLSELLPYLEVCVNNFYDYNQMTFHYALEEIKECVSKRAYSEFIINIVTFYSTLFAVLSKNDLEIKIQVNKDQGYDYEDLTETYEGNNNLYSNYDNTSIHNIFDKFFKNLKENDVKNFSSLINMIVKDYCEKVGEYLDEDILERLLKLKTNKLPIYKRHIINKYICSFFSDIIDTSFEMKKYKDIVDMYNHIDIDYEGKEEILYEFYFELAYSYSQIGNKNVAKELYQAAIEKGIESSAVYNNLGVIYANDADNERALFYYSKAYELDPKNETAKKNKESTEQIIKEAKKAEQKLRNTYFKKLQKYHKSILFAIHRYSDEVTDDVLHEIINQEKYTLKKNINFLQDNDMLDITQKGTYVINPIVEKWLDEYVNPTLERQIVKVDNSKLYRSIFYHESEINLYRVLIELFPQHFIFPNMSLKTLFDIDKLKELLEQDVVSYLFKAHVDFAIVNTATYFPVLAFEKDSEYNEKEPAKINSEYKNQIFKTGGIPLIRLKYNSGMDYETLKQQVKDATKSLILEIESGNNNSEFDLLKEIDKKKFGITNSVVDLKIIQKEWDSVVGSVIAIKSKIIDVADRVLIIEISNDLKPIIEMGKDNINKRMLEKFAFIDDIKYNWY